jgi:guanine deaminase
MSKSSTITAIRGSFLDVSSVCNNPSEIDDSLRYVADGLLLVENGHIHSFGQWQTEHKQLPEDCVVKDYSGKLIVPGFIDTHLHFPQTGIVGAYGEQLLQWLENYAFPAEICFAEEDHASEMADFFIGQLLSHGTTSAAVFCTVHPHSVSALFDAAQDVNMRIIAGKVMMDRNAPQALLDTPRSSYDQSRELIQRYHGQGRLLYAITPRFAPTSSPEQLEMAGSLKAEFPDCYVQTHLSENREEIAWVKQLFPQHDNYLDVYHDYGLTGPKSLFGHCLHLEEKEWQRMSDTGSVISFCPTSNLFLGSGLFDLQRARDNGVQVGMATDIGGGTSFSMLRTLAEAYKVAQLQQQRFSPYDALYMATLGGARALGLDHCIGSFHQGKEADFVVLDPQATPLQAKRCERTDNVADLFFSLMILGDERSVFRTYVHGSCVHKRGDF